MSMKIKMTIWYAVWILAAAGIMFGINFYLLSRLRESTEKGILSEVIALNSTEVWMKDGELYHPNFQAYSKGVYSLVFDTHGNLLLGTSPVVIDPSEYPLEGFVFGEAKIDGQTIYYYDEMIISMDVDWGDFLENYGEYDSGFAEGVWIRGIKSAQSGNIENGAFIRAILIILPILLATAIIGGCVIAGRALKPVRAMADTAKRISDEGNLSERIVINPGRDEMHDLAETFNGMMDRLERSFQAEKQFASDVSHEMRTPLAVVLGECDVAENAQSQEEFKDAVHNIRKNAVRMTKLVASLLSLTRLSQGTQKMEIETINMSDLAWALSDEYAENSKNIQIVPEITQDVYVNADATLLMVLMQNLVSNAVKYGKDGGHVWVSVTKDAGKAFFSVMDDGIGIPEDKLPYIWNRFYRADEARTKDGIDNGFGLGLPLAQEIARLHHGEITVSSEENKGSAFVFFMDFI